MSKRELSLLPSPLSRWKSNPLVIKISFTTVPLLHLFDNFLEKYVPSLPCCLTLHSYHTQISNYEHPVNEPYLGHYHIPNHLIWMNNMFFPQVLICYLLFSCSYMLLGPNYQGHHLSVSKKEKWNNLVNGVVCVGLHVSLCDHSLFNMLQNSDMTSMGCQVCAFLSSCLSSSREPMVFQSVCQS